ncbi:hypothetical protein J7M23_07580, partial [Candidatus Sumerlaeota bacterium]|nr:hypothetical protein [Candidatus Sumerlaeota bacterium]
YYNASSERQTISPEGIITEGFSFPLDFWVSGLDDSLERPFQDTITLAKGEIGQISFQKERFKAKCWAFY